MKTTDAKKATSRLRRKTADIDRIAESVRTQLVAVVKYCRYREKHSPCCRDVLRLLGMKSGKQEHDDKDEVCSCTDQRPTPLDDTQFCANCGFVIKNPAEAVK